MYGNRKDGIWEQKMLSTWEWRHRDYNVNCVELKTTPANACAETERGECRNFALKVYRKIITYAFPADVNCFFLLAPLSGVSNGEQAMLFIMKPPWRTLVSHLHDKSTTPAYSQMLSLKKRLTHTFLSEIQRYTMVTNYILLYVWMWMQRRLKCFLSDW